ncbi:MAG: hypothetical protein LBH64_05645 [Coriobacteriales bacterium]|jgi:hypothetical protein|nr:hypothetical protein [Coriobacteriales bacterium]
MRDTRAGGARAARARAEATINDDGTVGAGEGAETCAGEGAWGRGDLRGLRGRGRMWTLAREAIPGDGRGGILGV